MTEDLEPQDERVRRLRAFDPVLGAFVEAGIVDDVEADVLFVLGEADAALRPTRFATPREVSRFATAFACLLALHIVSRPRPSRHGPVALIGGSTVRRLVTELSVVDTPLSAALHPVRLRTDGTGRAMPTGRGRAGTDEDRLVLLSPRTRWPDPGRRFRAAVVDTTSLGSAIDLAIEWALTYADVVHVAAPLDPQNRASGYEIDWPFLATATACPLATRAQSWPLVGAVNIHELGAPPPGLEDARARIASAASRSNWPVQLSNAASLSRTLASIAVAPRAYDAHLRGSFVPSIAERVDELERSRAASLPPDWKTFAEVEWANLRRELVDAYNRLEDRNVKAERIGLLIEELLRRGARVAVVADTDTHTRALSTHLLAGGFGITADHFDAGALSVQSYGSLTGGAPSTDATVLTGVPSPWHVRSLLSAQLAGPLHLLCYPFESARVQRLLGWAVNGARSERSSERAATITAAIGRVALAPVPEPVLLRFNTFTDGGAMTSSLSEHISDSAEYAALADDSWLALVEQELQSPDDATSDQHVNAIAFVTHDDLILILHAASTVERLVVRRIIPVPATSVAVGMQLLLGPGSGGIFTQLRHRLDRIRGAGTRFWLEQWDQAFRLAVIAAGGPSLLAEAIRSRGATVTPQTVAAWASPYRIGPRDWQNVQRVATVGLSPVVATHARRVAVVMQGVRTMHNQIGRQLAAGFHRYVNGDESAFDAIEEFLGMPVEQLVGELELVTIRDVIGLGSAPRRTVGRTWTAGEAVQLFTPSKNDRG